MNRTISAINDDDLPVGTLVHIFWAGGIDAPVGGGNSTISAYGPEPVCGRNGVGVGRIVAFAGRVTRNLRADATWATVEVLAVDERQYIEEQITEANV